MRADGQQMGGCRDENGECSRPKLLVSHMRSKVIGSMSNLLLLAMNG